MTFWPVVTYLQTKPYTLYIEMFNLRFWGFEVWWTFLTLYRNKTHTREGNKQHLSRNPIHFTSSVILNFLYKNHNSLIKTHFYQTFGSILIMCFERFLRLETRLLESYMIHIIIQLSFLFQDRKRCSVMIEGALNYPTFLCRFVWYRKARLQQLIWSTCPHTNYSKS